MICMKSGKKNDKNGMIIIFVVIPLIIIIIIIIVIIVVMILKKKRTNDDYIEMDEDVYEVEMGGRKKRRLEISTTLYESGMTIVY